MRRTQDGQIELGDLILAIDGQSIESADDLLSAQENHKVGDTVTVLLLRDGQRREVKDYLGSGDLLKAIDRDFGGYDKFKQAFSGYVRDIVAGKDVPTPQATEQDILRGPTPHTAELLQSPYGIFVRHINQRFQIEVPVADGLRRLNHRPRFLMAESQRSYYAETTGTGRSEKVHWLMVAVQLLQMPSYESRPHTTCAAEVYGCS